MPTQQQIEFWSAFRNPALAKASPEEQRRMLGNLSVFKQLPEVDRGKVIDGFLKRLPDLQKTASGMSGLPPLQQQPEVPPKPSGGPGLFDKIATGATAVGNALAPVAKYATQSVPQSLAQARAAITGDKPGATAKKGLGGQLTEITGRISNRLDAESKGKDIPGWLKPIMQGEAIALSALGSMSGGLADFETSPIGRVFHLLPELANLPRSEFAKRVVALGVNTANTGVLYKQAKGAFDAIHKAAADPTPENKGDAIGKVAMLLSIGVMSKAEKGSAAKPKEEAKTEAKTEAPPEPTKKDEPVKPTNLAEEKDEYTKKATSAIQSNQTRLAELQAARRAAHLNRIDTKPYDKEIAQLEKHTNELQEEIKKLNSPPGAKKEEKKSAPKPAPTAENKPAEKPPAPAAPKATEDLKTKIEKLTAENKTLKKGLPPPRPTKKAEAPKPTPKPESKTEKPPKPAPKSEVKPPEESGPAEPTPAPVPKEEKTPEPAPQVKKPTKVEKPSTSVEEHVAESLMGKDGVVPVSELRQSGVSKEEFDQEVLKMYDQGRINLYRHDAPAHLTEAEKRAYVTDDKGNYYTGIGVRDPASTPAPETEVKPESTPEPKTEDVRAELEKLRAENEALKKGEPPAIPEEGEERLDHFRDQGEEAAKAGLPIGHFRPDAASKDPQGDLRAWREGWVDGNRAAGPKKKTSSGPPTQKTKPVEKTPEPPPKTHAEKAAELMRESEKKSTPSPTRNKPSTKSPDKLSDTELKEEISASKDLDRIKELREEFIRRHGAAAWREEIRRSSEAAKK